MGQTSCKRVTNQDFLKIFSLQSGGNVGDGINKQVLVLRQFTLCCEAVEVVIIIFGKFNAKRNYKQV